MKNTFIFIAAISAVFLPATAAEPAGYYSACENLGGQNLLKAVHSTISDHNTVSYSGLWDLYKTSDVDADGKIWDMYSTKRWNPGREQCGTYSKIGDCYNREHSLPKSWFNDASPMYSDAFHIYPTDGKVNGQRSNYPFGECANGSQVASSGSVKPLGKLGASTFDGYSGTVFEPDDQYKGDFARSYFYMAACYNDRIASWKSDMLAKNSYPVFSSWALKLLLKWHRQDPVSDKEIKRNEAVYSRQGNRNPFIDHPEMVEYIWGDKSSERWSSGAEIATAINSPLDGSTIEMGQMMVGMSAVKTITLKTTATKETVLLSTDADMFVVSPTSVPAAAANAGTTVTLTYTPVRKGYNRAILYVTAGTTSALVDVEGTGIDRLPVNGARDISSDAFTATWAYVGDDTDGDYTLDVRQGGVSIDGYPRAVDARAGAYTVDGLDASTAYTYTVRSRNYSSDEVAVVTAAPIPYIAFLYEGTLTFATAPGVPSEAEEITVDIDNIDTDYTVSVSAPFEISLDKAGWTTSLTLTPDDTRLYMRLYSETAGSFRTSIRAVCGDYTNDESTVEGIVADGAAFHEDFEAEGLGSYDPQTYLGSACRWNLSDAGFWSDKANTGKQALRGGKSGKALIEMDEDRTAGIGTVSFYAHVWNSDAAPAFAVEYSTDGGETWTAAGSVTLEGTAYRQYSVAVNVAGTARMRLRQTEGKRFLLDDIEMNGYTGGLANPGDSHYSWDAFARNGELMIEIKDANGLDVNVYDIDGTTIYSGHLMQGVHTIPATGRFIIVAAGATARTVLLQR